MSTEPRELVELSKVQRMLAEVHDIDTIKDIRDKAQAATAYAKKAKLTDEIIFNAAEIKLYTERRLGEILSSLPLANSAPGNQYTGKRMNGSHHATGPFRLRDFGVTKSDSSRFQQIASLPAATFHRYVKHCVESGQERIYRSQLAAFFRQLHILTTKTDRDFAAILASCGREPAQAWSVGNSVRSDINPAIRTGMSAVLIQRPTWEYEDEPLLPAPRVFVVNTLTDAVGLIIERSD